MRERRRVERVGETRVGIKERCVGEGREIEGKTKGEQEMTSFDSAGVVLTRPPLPMWVDHR